MLSSLLIITRRGEVLVHRAYREDVSRSESLLFCQKVVTREVGDPPVVSIGLCSFVYIIADEVIIVAATKQNSNAMLITTVLYKILSILKSYFEKTSEDNIRKNFVLIYELLDEVLDYGFPQVLDRDLLKMYITQGRQRLSPYPQTEEQLKGITAQATGACSWRAEGIKYRKNELYLDVIESVNALISQKGQELFKDAAGQVMVKSCLSGMPECKFGINDRLSLGKSKTGVVATRGIAIDDVRFHHCVKLNKFDVDRTVTFIPPDGTFQLMTYRITENVALPFRVSPFVQERGRSRIDISVQIKSTFSKNLSASNVLMRIPLPNNAAKAVISNYNNGKAQLELGVQSSLVWRIRRFPGETEYMLIAEVQMASGATETRWSRKPIALDFQVPSFMASGLCVRFLHIKEKSNYRAVKWIRYLTKAGTFHHRI